MEQSRAGFFQTRLGLWLLGLALLVSLLLRLIHIDAPLLESFGFRQTQTAMTVWWFLQDGISLFDPQLPVFGPPWRVPFEFPIFQACAAMLIKITGMEIDIACRVTNIAFFYASVVMLYFLSEFVFARRSTTVCILLIYLFSPFCIVWSRTSMIEYAAVAFALAYLYWILRWMDQPRKGWWLPLILLAGILGSLTKITTMAITVLPILGSVAYVFYLDFLELRKGGSGRNNMIARSLFFYVILFALLLIPIVVGQAWVTHTDHIKAASLRTNWLTSANLLDWNYGTYYQRLNPHNWVRIFLRIPQQMLPGVCFLLPAALLMYRSISARACVFLCAAFLTVLFPVLIFFNLYLNHDYYFSAITPCLAIVAGCGLDAVCVKLQRYHRYSVWAVVLVLVFSLASTHAYLRSAFWPNKNLNAPCVIGQIIRDSSATDEYVLITDHNWSPEILYYARRRGCMVNVPNSLSYDDVPKEKIAIVVTPSLDHPMLSRWESRKILSQVGRAYIIKVH